MKKYIVRFVPEEYEVEARTKKHAALIAEKLYNKKHNTWLPAQVLDVEEFLPGGNWLRPRKIPIKKLSKK